MVHAFNGELSQNASASVISTKKPPPESAESIRTRSLVVASFWAIIVFLGLPTWWWTTSIHRARLPLQEMLEWADGKACKPAFPLQIAFITSSMQESEAEHLVRTTQHALDDLNEFSAHHLRLYLAKIQPSRNQTGSVVSVIHDQISDFGSTNEIPSDDDEPALTVRLFGQDGIAGFSSHLEIHSTKLDVFYPSSQVPSTLSSSSVLANFIAVKLQDLFAEEQATIAHILSSTSVPNTNYHSPAGQGQSAQISQPISASSRESRARAAQSMSATRLASRMSKSLKYSPTYHLTISLFTPTATPSAWEIEASLAEYLIPLLDALSRISNFTIDTQVQLYAAFSPSVQKPELDPDSKLWTLREEDLSGFVNAAEWPLSPSIGAGPTLNFVIYIPDPRNTPLVIKGSEASSWLIPQWGGVFILNPASATTELSSMLSKEAIQPALLTFSHQLLAFLGAPQTPPSLPLQLQTLTRIRAASLLLSASSTMGSLARLTVALPSIAIPETVSTAVDTTLNQLRNTCDALRHGKFAKALHTARIAETEAEKGFFEKSMVGQVYFPDEHKVAVYLPLLGPIGVPLVMSALKELRRLWTLAK